MRRQRSSKGDGRFIAMIAVGVFLTLTAATLLVWTLRHPTDQPAEQTPVTPASQ